MEQGNSQEGPAITERSSCLTNFSLGCTIALSTVGINCLAMMIGLTINDGHINKNRVGYIAAGTGLANCVGAPVIILFLCCTLNLQASAKHYSHQVKDFFHGMLVGAVYACFSSCICLIGCASCAMDVSFPSGCCKGFEIARFSPEARKGVVFGVCALILAVAPLLASFCESDAKSSNLKEDYKNAVTGIAVIAVGAAVTQGAHALGKNLWAKFFSSTNENAADTIGPSEPLMP